MINEAEEPEVAEVSGSVAAGGGRGRKAARKVAAGGRKAARAGMQTAAKGLERAQKTVTQSDAFSSFNTAMAEMTMVVSVQHARISDLEHRVEVLEAALRTLADGR